MTQVKYKVMHPSTSAAVGWKNTQTLNRCAQTKINAIHVSAGEHKF